MRKIVLLVLLIFSLFGKGLAQVDKREVRAGNRAYLSGDIEQAELDYRRALTENPFSVNARYNLGNALYKRGNGEEADKTVKPLADSLANSPIGPALFHNLGNYALDQKKYSEAIEHYKNSLRLFPDDYQTKSNLAYAQKMLENQEDEQQGGEGDNQDQNEDQDQNDNQDQNQDDQSQDNQNQDQNQDNQTQEQDNQPQPKITPQDAQQMLQAIQNKENETQEKVSQEKAKLLESRQKEKNW